MNRQLVDPFQSLQLPNVIEEVLEQGIARSIAFNRRGTLLAAGCEDGQIVLWDFETRGVASILTGHSQAVTCLEWSKDGRTLVSGSLDGHVKRWKVEDGSQEASFDMGSSVSAISVDEHAAHLCVVSHAAAGPPHIISFCDGHIAKLPTVSAEKERKAAAETSVAIADRSGSVIYVGQSNGTILVVDSASLQISDIIKVQGSPRIAGLTLNQKGNLLLVLPGDRVIRLYEVNQHRQALQLHTVDEARSTLLASKGAKSGSLLSSGDPALRLQREFQDAVQRNGWRCAAFTSDSEHVIGSVGGNTRDGNSVGHILYIWEAYSGRFKKVLESRGSGAAVALAAHPLRQELAAVTSAGKIAIWCQEMVENWSAFAPDFKELQTNVDYEEREDEFDINERPSSATTAEANEASETEVDIIGAEDEARFSSDEEGLAGQPALHHLPVVIRPQSPPPPPKKAKAESSDDADSDGDDDGPSSGGKQQHEKTPIKEEAADRDSGDDEGNAKRQKR